MGSRRQPGQEGSGMGQPPGRRRLRAESARFAGDVGLTPAGETSPWLKCRPLSPKNSVGEEGAAPQTQALWVCKAAGKRDWLENPKG